MGQLDQLKMEAAAPEPLPTELGGVEAQLKALRGNIRGNPMAAQELQSLKQKVDDASKALKDEPGWNAHLDRRIKLVERIDEMMREIALVNKIEKTGEAHADVQQSLVALRDKIKPNYAVKTTANALSIVNNQKEWYKKLGVGVLGAGLIWGANKVLTKVTGDGWFGKALRWTGIAFLASAVINHYAGKQRLAGETRADAAAALASGKHPNHATVETYAQVRYPGPMNVPGMHEAPKGIWHPEAPQYLGPDVPPQGFSAGAMAEARQSY